MKHTITRRDLLRTVSAGTVGLAAGGAIRAAARPAGKGRPNILWITAEDMNPWLSCYGTKLITTPIFDGMAAEGVRFSRAYVTAPVCSPCRSALITGTMQTTLGIHSHRSSRDNARKPEHKGLGLIHLPKGVKTVPEYFQDAGYVTFNMGKTDYNFVYDNKKVYNIASLKAAAAQDRPFFGQIQLKGGKNGKVSLKGKMPVRPDQVPVPPYYPDHPVYRDMIADHYACVLGTDVSTGKILDELKSLGLLDDTIVFFFSDHGMPGGLRHKQFCYEGGIHVPLIVRWPKSFAAPPQYSSGAVNEQLVSLLDLTATTLGFAGLKKPAGMQSRIFLGSDADPPRRHVFTHRDRHDEVVQRIRSVRSDRHRYIRNFIPERPFLFFHAHKEAMYPVIPLLRELHKEGKLNAVQQALLAPRMPDEELYDLENDPYEVNNLAGSPDPEHQRVLQQLRGTLDNWIEETDDQGRHLEPPELVQQWIKVMYDRWGGPPEGFERPYVYGEPYWPLPGRSR